MGTYGRNFDFLETPTQSQRLGRMITGNTDLVHGAPVIAGTTVNAEGRRTIAYAVNTDAPAIGSTGIVISEKPYTAFHGSDPVITRPSDIDKALAKSAAQVVFGTQVRVELRNTTTLNFQGQRSYPGRTMVASLDALVVGDLLTPVATPSDVNGYWQKAAGGNTPWLRVTSVNTVDDIVQAQFLF